MLSGPARPSVSVHPSSVSRSQDSQRLIQAAMILCVHNMQTASTMGIVVHHLRTVAPFVGGFLLAIQDVLNDHTGSARGIKQSLGPGDADNRYLLCLSICCNSASHRRRSWYSGNGAATTSVISGHIKISVTHATWQPISLQGIQQGLPHNCHLPISLISRRRCRNAHGRSQATRTIISGPKGRLLSPSDSTNGAPSVLGST